MNNNNASDREGIPMNLSFFNDGTSPPTSRVPALSLLSDLGTDKGKLLLEEISGKVIENIQKSTISSRLKNMNLSGDPQGGSLEAHRFVNAKSSEYGTARGKGKGELVKARPVVVQINRDREIVEEIEQKDILLFSVNGLLQRRSVNHEKTLIRELERAFFQEAADNSAELVTDKSAIEEVIEAMIQKIETTKNEFVDGVDRDMMNIICNPDFYGQMRNYLDRGTNNAHISTSAESINTFHGVRIESSVYIPATVKAQIMVDGSVAMPVIPRPYTAEKIPLSEAWAVQMFFYYGVKAVTPDLMAKISIDPSRKK